MTRHKLERQGSASTTRTQRKYPPGMTYEEIASSRTASVRKEEVVKKDDQTRSSDRESPESIEPIQEKDIKATGPDPYEKLNYKTGKYIFTDHHLYQFSGHENVCA